MAQQAIDTSGGGKAATAARVSTAPASGMLGKGWHKISLNIPPALHLVVKALQTTRNGGQMWDGPVKSVVENGFKAKGVNLKLPTSSTFWLNAQGQARSTPAKGYTAHVRKGYDEAKRVFWFWVQVL
jgi:hypothetical protein